MQEKQTIVEEKESKSSMMEENMKYISLAMLIVMNTAQVIFMRYARTVSAETYNSMTAVIMGEVMKIIMSFLLMVNDNRSARKAVSALVEQARENTREVLFQSVPALLYTIQNFFMYVAISNLDAGIFQICTRMKILITALLSVLILGKKLRFLQWVSLFLLVLGVIIIKTSSSLAGVFMEKMFKDRKLTVWNRNFWLAVWSFIVGFTSAVVQNPQIVYPSVFFKNYNIWAWIAITLLAVGGLVIGLVLKYADNILKAFAGSASILFSTLISCVLFHTKISARFGVGAAIVMVAVVLYSYGAKGVQYKPLSKVETPSV